MRYITYDSLMEADYTTAAHRNVIDNFVNNFEEYSVIKPYYTNTGTKNLDLTDFSYDDLTRMHFHYSHKNNGRSIEKYGLISQIGENSKDIDEKEAIYFSVGYEAVLHNWDIWLKWRLNRFCNPVASGVHCHSSIGRDVWMLALIWMKHMSSKDYRYDNTNLEQVFKYEKIELERSDYYALTIVPGFDYPKEQIDEKKSCIIGSAYAAEIYGVGVSTDLSNDFAEQWNRYTEPGKKTCIPPQKVWRLTAEGHNDALSILQYLYRIYLENCQSTNKEPANFALLPKFMAYCETH